MNTPPPQEPRESPEPQESQEPKASSPSTLALFDLLGRRWALRVLWELREEPLPFQTVQARCDSMSTSVLSQRLTELRTAGLVEKEEQGSYRLTLAGVALLERLQWVDEWTSQWSKLIGGTLQGDGSAVSGPARTGTSRRKQP